MSTLDDFHELLMPELPGCSVPLMQLHLMQALREFCLKTSAWTVPFAAVNLVAGQADYGLVPPVADSEVVRVKKLTLAGVLLWEDALTIEDARAPRHGRDDPPFTVSADMATLTLGADEVPAAALTSGMQLVGVLKPTATAATLPDFLYSQYSDAIRVGTLSRLMAMGNQGWTDRELATKYASDWASALSFAGYQADVGNTRKTLRVRMWG